MALIDKETIRKEIERKQRIARYQWRPQSEQLCQELLDWLDTIPEQPVERLEEELENYAKLYPFEDAGSYRNLITLARHFAEWGANHLNARKEE